MATTSAPQGPTSQQKRRRKDVVLTVVTLAAVLLVCTAAGIGAFAMANSWWTEDDPVPSADQQLADGQSRFDRAGVDFFTRQGEARIDLTSPASAADLGLDPDEASVIEPIAPVALEIAGSGEATRFAGVSWFQLTTSGDRVTEVAVLPPSSGDWRGITTDLRARGAEWGWSEEQIAELETELSDAARADDGRSHTAALPPASVDGISVEARVTIAASGGVELLYVFSR
ncbi:hypothetical protein ABC195_05215 [Microbacterium sp. 2P01SA-2]|uniref:hypothetical protein n=1 Tax=unclassified Microbacterium TaxID=2609290 RepID=UPI00399FF002